MEHFEQNYGALRLDPSDAARYVFATGWNCALQEFLRHIMAMPMERDTKASFAVFLQTQMCVDPAEAVAPQPVIQHLPSDDTEGGAP
jgi:hypothetical protein